MVCIFSTCIYLYKAAATHNGIYFFLSLFNEMIFYFGCFLESSCIVSGYKQQCVAV